jgi:hypothetical protein
MSNVTPFSTYGRHLTGFAVSGIVVSPSWRLQPSAANPAITSAVAGMSASTHVTHLGKHVDAMAQKDAGRGAEGPARRGIPV